MHRPMLAAERPCQTAFATAAARPQRVSAPAAWRPKSVPVEQRVRHVLNSSNKCIETTTMIKCVEGRFHHLVVEQLEGRDLERLLLRLDPLPCAIEVK